jgi:hypothetical protein
VVVTRKKAETDEALPTNTPALGELKDKVSRLYERDGFLTGLDGRHLLVRSEHSTEYFVTRSRGNFNEKIPSYLEQQVKVWYNRR